MVETAVPVCGGHNPLGTDQHSLYKEKELTGLK